jgi:thiol:disulfide interchange protein DsbD
MAELVGRLPMPVADAATFHQSNGEIHFDLLLKDTGIESGEIKNVLFFPESDGLITNAAAQKAQVSPDRISIAIGQAEGKETDNGSGLVSLYLKNGTRRDFALRLQSENMAAQVAAMKSQPVVKSLSEPIRETITLATAILYALIGGLILNAMPCVFPVLSLKALAVAKKAAAHPSEARRQGIAYTSGVIVSFQVLAFALLLFQKGGQAVGWGYQMQSPLFVTFLALLLFTVSLNLAGYFELPVLFGNLGNEKASRDSAWGSFFTGVLAVMVATPCTAPFMAPAIGFALTQSHGTIFAVFGALGLGLSSPFLVVSFFPRLIRILPKPGMWMITFKEFLSFPMFAWTVWLLWLIAREAGSGASAIVLIGMILIAFGIWLWRHGNAFLRLIALLLSMTGISAAFFGANMPMPQLIASVAHDDQDRFSAAKLESLRKQGKAVFVDATADWCLICKVNESVALSSPQVQKAFKDKHVSYMVADWTYGDSEITHYLEAFGRSGVPIYVYYAPNSSAPVVLPQVLTPSVVLEVLQ